jgi:hypothetical protein
MFMKQQPRTVRQPIVVDLDTTTHTSTTVLSTSDLDFNFDPGLRTTVGMRLGEGWALEFSYFGLFQGTASATAGPDPNANLNFPISIGNVFVGMDTAQVKYSSWVHSFELNLPCCCGCCDECCDECGCATVSDEGCCAAVRGKCCCGEVRYRSFEWFAGFRFIDLGEELNILAQKTVLPGGLEEGTYDIHTANQLYGAQLGARWRRAWSRFGWEATCKAGIFGNGARETQSVTDFPNVPLRPTVSSSGGEVAFVGEINLSLFYRLTDVWSLRAGYNVMWIEGLALAPDQLDFNFATSPSGNQLNNSGGMFLQGVNAGLEARW